VDFPAQPIFFSAQLIFFPAQPFTIPCAAVDNFLRSQFFFYAVKFFSCAAIFKTPKHEEKNV
jgi:hypothetical protein